MHQPLFPASFRRFPVLLTPASGHTHRTRFSDSTPTPDVEGRHCQQQQHRSSRSRRCIHGANCTAPPHDRRRRQRRDADGADAAPLPARARRRQAGCVLGLQGGGAAAHVHRRRAGGPRGPHGGPGAADAGPGRGRPRGDPVRGGDGHGVVLLQAARREGDGARDAGRGAGGCVLHAGAPVPRLQAAERVADERRWAAARRRGGQGGPLLRAAVPRAGEAAAAARRACAARRGGG